MNNQIDDGGPALPVASDVIGHCSGMSLRDWFAGMALQGTMSGASYAEKRSFESYPHIHAQNAYKMADAMLAARKEQP